MQLTYGLYQALLVINILSILFTKKISFLPYYISILGFLLIIIAAILDLYWEIFWLKHKQSMVTKGIYSYIRHPFLTFIILASFGISLTFNHLISLIISIITVVIIFKGSKQEEDFLIKKFGNKYKEYIAKVPYRFIPRII